MKQSEVNPFASSLSCGQCDEHFQVLKVDENGEPASPTDWNESATADAYYSHMGEAHPAQDNPGDETPPE